MGSFKESVRAVASAIGKRNPELVVRIRYFLRFHRRINLNNPKTLNEKIQYLSLRTDTSEWTRLSDKFLVREYVKECGLENILVHQYGVWDSADEIDFSMLPDRFVIKTTHRSGDAIFVKDKSQTDMAFLKEQIGLALKRTYGLSEGNLHYSRIHPRVIAEELLENDAVSASYSSSVIDYKIWCFNGKAYYIWVCTDRSHEGAKVLLYDTDWNVHPEYSVFTRHYMRGIVIPKPVGIDRMLEIAEKLAKPFPVVRVDLYNVAGKVYFSEMTFTSLGGYMDFYNDDFLRMTGSMINLNSEINIHLSGIHFFSTFIAVLQNEPIND